MANTFEIQDVFHIFSIGSVISGIVVEGEVRVSATVAIEDKNFSVNKMEVFHKQVDSVSAPNPVAIFLEGDKVDKDFFKRQKGQILTFSD